MFSRMGSLIFVIFHLPLYHFPSLYMFGFFSCPNCLVTLINLECTKSPYKRFTHNIVNRTELFRLRGAISGLQYFIIEIYSILGTTKYIRVYTKSTTVSIPSLELGPPPSPARECVSPPVSKGGGVTQSDAGEGVGGPKFGRL
jgi:hypothetical protein